MKFSAIIALSIAALASAQVPKGSGTGAPPAGGAAGGAPKGFPKGGAGGAKGFGGACAASCLAAPMQNSACKLTGLFPKGAGGAPGAMGAMPAKPAGGKAPGGKPAGGMAGMPGMTMVARQETPPKPTGAPKFSLSPEQSSAIASARSCFCGEALKGAGACVASACATATDGGAGAVKMLNGMCKGVAGYSPLTAAPPAPAAATPAA